MPETFIDVTSPSRAASMPLSCARLPTTPRTWFATASAAASPRGWYRAPLPRRPAPQPKAPSIPMPDDAWGYDEDERGELRLLRPASPSGTPRGPAAYTPNFDASSMHTAAPMYGFGLGSERPMLREVGREAAPEAAAEDDVPRRLRQPMPLAALARRRARRSAFEGSSPHSHSRSPPPRPGPGAFDPPAGLGETCAVLSFPPQARHHVRPRATLPLPPLKRGAVHEVQQPQPLPHPHARLARTKLLAAAPTRSEAAAWPSPGPMRNEPEPRCNRRRRLSTCSVWRCSSRAGRALSSPIAPSTSGGAARKS